LGYANGEWGVMSYILLGVNNW